MTSVFESQPRTPQRLSRRGTLQALATLALVPGVAAWAATPANGRTTLRVKDFSEQTWAQLLEKGPRPAAYVFTTTYCSTCPEVFEQLSQAIRGRARKVELIAVVMDAQGERALVHAHHYHGLTQLYAFDGFEPVIRQSVDPQWRNVTPYVVLVDRRGTLQRVIGPPEPASLRAWLS